MAHFKIRKATDEFIKAASDEGRLFMMRKPKYQRKETLSQIKVKTGCSCGKPGAFGGMFFEGCSCFPLMRDVHSMIAKGKIYVTER